MSVVHLIDTVAEWARHNVCDKIKLKMPPENTEANDADYDYQEVNPSVFPMYVPTSEKLPPNIHSPFPSLCVRFFAGEDSVTARKGFVDVQFCFSTWDPGLHGRDLFHPLGDGSFSRQGDIYAEFQRNADGWRSVWNFVDIALRAVESVDRIGDYSIDHATPIKFGPLTEQEAIPDFYPFWFAEMTFRVTYPLRRNNEDYQNLL